MRADGKTLEESMNEVIIKASVHIFSVTTTTERNAVTFYSRNRAISAHFTPLLWLSILTILRFVVIYAVGQISLNFGFHVLLDILVATA